MVEKVIWRYHNGQDGQACVQCHMESSLDFKLGGNQFRFQLSTINLFEWQQFEILCRVPSALRKDHQFGSLGSE